MSDIEKNLKKMGFEPVPKSELTLADPKRYAGCACSICKEIVAGKTKVWLDADGNVARMETVL